MASRIIHPTCSYNPNSTSSTSLPSLVPNSRSNVKKLCRGSAATVRLTLNRNIRTTRLVVRSSSKSSRLGNTWEEWWKMPSEKLNVPCLSDILWPSAGAFAAMALLGRLDQMVALRGLSFTIAPLGAVCAVLFTAPNSPAAQKYNMFVAQIGCAATGVLALLMFGPGWLARATALAASIAFMIATGASHPPAASLPILFIDGAKFHNLNLWYAFFPARDGDLFEDQLQILNRGAFIHYVTRTFGLHSFQA